MMRIHAIKGRLGYNPVPEGEEYTHWILDREAFNDFKDSKNELTRYKDAYKNLKNERDKYKSYYEECRNQVEQYKASWSKRENELKAREEEIIARDMQSRFNQKTIEDVISIFRERANKERKLPGKRSNPGYVLIESSEAMLNKYKIFCWKTVIQTPFIAEIKLDDMIDMANSDMNFFKLRSGWNLGSLPEEDLDTLQSWEIDKIKKPCIYQTNYRRNFRNGYWEAIIYHSDEVTL